MIDGIELEVFSLDNVIRKLYSLPTLDNEGEYIPSNVIMSEALEYVSCHNIVLSSQVSFESIGRAMRRALNPKVKHRRAMTRGMKTIRYLLTRANQSKSTY